MNKKNLTERDICTKFITPALVASGWDVLDYFSSATQIGLTATPKETEYVSNIHYFGEPVYTYSLKQGIHDGFLAPYKVVKVHLDVDVEGYRLLRRYRARCAHAPCPRQREPRPRAAERALCHAHHRRRSRRGRPGRQFHRSGSEVPGHRHHFSDPDFDGDPVQIYEPGEYDPVSPPDNARSNDDAGDAIQPMPGDDERIVVDPLSPNIGITAGATQPEKYYINGGPVSILAERIEYLDENGKLITESLRDYSKKTLWKRFASLDAFLRRCCRNTRTKARPASTIRTS